MLREGESGQTAGWNRTACPDHRRGDARRWLRPILHARSLPTSRPSAGHERPAMGDRDPVCALPRRRGSRPGPSSISAAPRPNSRSSAWMSRRFSPRSGICKSGSHPITSVVRSARGQRRRKAGVFVANAWGQKGAEKRRIALYGLLRLSGEPLRARSYPGQASAVICARGQQP
jgi:hypothetical protein